MDVLRDGSVTLNIQTDHLAKGLRPFKSAPRNAKYLTECIGAVGTDGVLQTLDDLSTYKIDTSIITDGFPYPQLFTFVNAIIVCGKTTIYEYINGALELKLSSLTSAYSWHAVDFHDFVYLCNGQVVVTRNAHGIFTVSTDYIVSASACNFNGQFIVGSPHE